MPHKRKHKRRWRKHPDGIQSYYQTDEWRQLREYVLERDHYQCVIIGCSSPAQVVDHIISRKAGGADHPANLRSLCGTHDRMIKERTPGGERRLQGVLVNACDAQGLPLDPAHPWHRKAK